MHRHDEIFKFTIIHSSLFFHHKLYNCAVIGVVTGLDGSIILLYKPVVHSSPAIYLYSLYKLNVYNMFLYLKCN
jgi:hypothetical protein